MIEQEGKNVEILELNTPKEVDLDEGELLQVANEKRNCVKGWWILFSIYTAVWLLYPIIGSKGGPAPIRRMPYSDALIEFIWPHLILSAITYYYLIIKMNFDMGSGRKMVLKTTIKKLSKDTKKKIKSLFILQTKNLNVSLSIS